MHNIDSLYNQLNIHLIYVNQAVAAVQAHAYDQDISEFEMRNSDGSYALTNLLLAKALCLAGMASLKAKQ